MDGKILARLGAVIFVAIAVTATAIEMTRQDETPANPVAPMVAPSAPDPLREGQRRCQRLGEAGARDAECLRVWAESRDRFLGLDRQRPSVPSDDDPVTKETAPTTQLPAEER
ncbi:putative entry exclusion protein TrbK-alt [Brevundimonas sp. SL130]|uniref:putative entry exclusion protein TrbK-alt n=1 Tax=Brevundimonas sp. SL130 TaxID=2995143 RepID=UPI00226CA448|nr:putative entry exclusion protein TrbK-alt [Brevundimonas sp. SL130]WAC61310.1 putative entry exclusion protein TrbK-alt [Brevundimonas sp. SL130]